MPNCRIISVQLQLSQKLEQRLGPVLLICLATIGTVLTINGLFHEKARASLVQMMDTLEQELLQIQASTEK